MNKKKRNYIFITNRGVCRLIWFAVGQGVQLLLHGLFLNWWEQYQIPMCAAGGFIIFFFLFVGCWVTAKEREQTHWEDMQ